MTIPSIGKAGGTRHTRPGLAAGVSGHVPIRSCCFSYWKDVIRTFCNLDTLADSSGGADHPNDSKALIPREIRPGTSPVNLGITSCRGGADRPRSTKCSAFTSSAGGRLRWTVQRDQQIAVHSDLQDAIPDRSHSRGSPELPVSLEDCFRRGVFRRVGVASVYWR